MSHDGKTNKTFILQIVFNMTQTSSVLWEMDEITAKYAIHLSIRFTFNYKDNPKICDFLNDW